MGRANECDVVLLEGMVSRHHARFRVLDESLVIEDLGSTNGTFVNGARVRRRQLDEGDRVLIGTSILKIVWTSAAAGPPSLRGTEEVLDDEQSTTDGKVAGRINDVAVHELFERFIDPESSGNLVFVHDGEVGEVSVRGGFVEAARIDSLPAAPPKKCLLRMLAYHDGAFMVDAYRDMVAAPLDIRIAELLVEGLHLVDELQMLQAKLPGKQARVSLTRAMGPRLAALEAADLDIIQLSHNTGSVQAVIDQSSETDVVATRRLLNLVDAGYLRVTSGS